MRARLHIYVHILLTFHRRVSPRLIVAWEDSQVATTYELLVVHTQDWVVAVQEVRVEDDLDAVARVVEELHALDLGQNRVVVIIRHIVRHDRQ